MLGEGSENLRSGLIRFGRHDEDPGCDEDFVGMWLGGWGEVCWGGLDLWGALCDGLVVGLRGV